MRFKPAHTPEKLQQIEDGEFSTVDILLIIWTTTKKLTDRASIILWSSFLLLMLWGFHGDMAILTHVFGKGWTKKISFDLAWGEQLVSFVVGFLLVVVIPCLVIKVGFKGKIKEYGLGVPDKDQKRKAWVAFFSLLIVTSIFVFAASFDGGMQEEYPLFAKHDGGEIEQPITSWWEFLIYEMVYLLFFITIEFAFRGYLLFGLQSIRFFPKTTNSLTGSIQRFGIYSILIQMLAYTTWHYGKPVPEMIGTVIWGVCVAAIALRLRSIWPIIIAHWLYNVLLDLLIWTGLNRKILSIFS
jgi:membrane protease YdiL (CAAX protease family)